jgi:hypothetical protein
VQTASANSSETYTLTVSNNAGGAGTIGLLIVQMRGTANAAADQTASCDANTAGNHCSGPPNTTSDTSSNVTTTHSAAIVLMGSTATAGTTFTPVSSGCLGTTGTIPSNEPSGTINGQVQYAILSTTQTGTCAFTLGGSVTHTAQLATFH